MNNRPSQRYRVLFVVNASGFFISHRLCVAMAAAGAGFDVHVAAPDTSHVDAIEGQGLAFHEIEMERTWTNPIAEAESLASIAQLYAQVRPDIVHHVSLKPILIGSIAARIARVPVTLNAFTGLGYLFTDRGENRRVTQKAFLGAYRLLGRHARTYSLFQNPDDLELFARDAALPLARCTSIKGSGVDLDAFPFVEERPKARPVVVLPARMLWDKGVGDFVEAARRLASDRAAKFVLVGAADPGNPSAVPVDQIRQWVESGVVDWWGFRSDMHSVLAGASIVCLPSYREGLPKALLEAAAVGRPVVASDVPGCREVVKHEHTGLLVPAGRPDLLASAIKSLLDDPAKRCDMGRRGRRLVESEHSDERIAQATVALYKRMVHSV